MADRQINVSARVEAEAYFKFKALCKAHGFPAEKVIEFLIKEVVKDNYIDLTPSRSPSPQEFKGPGSMVGS